MIWQATDGDFAPKGRLARQMNGHGRADWIRRDDEAAKRPFGAIAVGGGFGAKTGGRRLRLQAMVPRLLSNFYRFCKAKFLHFQRKYF